MRVNKNWVRLLGLALLVFLLTRVDLAQIGRLLLTVNPLLLVVAVLLNLPQIGVKAARWRRLLRTQGIDYGLKDAQLAYFSSIFIGLLTPARLGEFIKAVYVSRDCDVSAGQAFASVLVDRLFDLYMLLFVGGTALLTLGGEGGELLAVVVAMLALTVPVALFINEAAFAWIRGIGQRFGRLGQRLFAETGWLLDMRRGLLQLGWLSLGGAVISTVIAYTLFFGQCYLLALALELPVGFAPVSFAVAVGSLITLLPISISGLGTREAAIIAYLGTVNVPAEAALSFSLLVFATFYIAGGLMGAAAWWLKPVDWKQHQQRAQQSEG